MPQLRPGTLFVAIVFMIALATASSQAQTKSKKPSASSKTELRPQTIHLHLVQHRTFSPMKWKRKDMGNQDGYGFVPVDALFAGYLHDTNGSTGGVAYEWRNEFYRGALRFQVFSNRRMSLKEPGKGG